jgi:hypothetical protein
MVTLPLPLLIVIALIFSAALALTAEEASTIGRRQLLAIEQHDDHVHIDINIKIKISNPRLLAAHTALQALKHALYSDPGNFTGNWDGPDVCAYNGVFCVPAPDDPSARVVASLDMNGADVAGHLPKEIGLMTLHQVPRLPAQKSAGKGTKSAGKDFSRHKKKCCVYSSRGRSLPAFLEKCR